MLNALMVFYATYQMCNYACLVLYSYIYEEEHKYMYDDKLNLPMHACVRGHMSFSEFMYCTLNHLCMHNKKQHLECPHEGPST